MPNPRGLERALGAGAREIAVVLSATETMNQRNINMGLARAAEVSAQTLALAQQEVVIVDTIGAAASAEMKHRLALLLQALPGPALAVHLHDARGLGSALV